ncbi:class I SAM-dependent methyltransferase [candidate division WOR-3 bacterium]|nr:class I SAM-dependent methyltransferase [candidate division WOR-3 bacterium]
MNQREFFDSHADTWDADRDPEQITKIGSLIQALAIRDNEFILDVGTGTGILFPFFKNSPYIAIDISFKMLQNARQKHGAKGMLVQTDVCALPFSRSGFDRAILFAVFPHINDKTQALVELYDVLKPGGRINIFHAASREAINSFHTSHGGAIEHDLIPTTPEMHALMVQAGFKDIEILDKPDRYLATAVK